jgi:hypothetical protein
MYKESNPETSDMLFQGSSYIMPEKGGDTPALALSFRNSLKEALQTPTQVIDFEDVLTQASDQNDKTLTHFCSKLIKEKVHDDPYISLYTHDSKIARLMDGLPNMFLSRTSIGETSAHKVFFSLLTGETKSLRVAVKPFVLAPDKAITEWTNTMLARNKGLDTFHPLGFLICNGKGFTITLRQNDIDSLDNVDWSKTLLMPEQYQNMIDDLKKIGPALARLNHKGIYHGDPQMKNVVLTQRGSLHWIDWESATFISKSDSSTTQEAEDLVLHKTERDLRVLFSSLARPINYQGVGLLDGKTPQTQLQYFDQLILRPYFDERMKLLEDESPEVVATVFSQLDQIEKAITSYILNEELKRSLSHSRHNPKL